MTALLAATSLLYAVACGLYFLYALRGAEHVKRSAQSALVFAVSAHVVFIAVDSARGRHPFADVSHSLSIASLLISIAQLVALRRHKLAVLGAFTTPVTLAFFLGAGFGAIVGSVPEPVRSVLLPIHVGINLLGIVAFGLAFGIAVAYLTEERLLRRKRIGGLFLRLPPLDVLDGLGFRLVTAGFLLLTAGIVSGAVFAVQTGPAVSVSHVVAILAWLCFAAVLGLRVAAGWRGRRAAIGTMLGFACSVVVLVGYALRDAGVR